MTVEELIAVLQTHPPDMPVVIDHHSEYAITIDVEEFEGFDAGGYVSRIYEWDHDKDRPNKRVYLRLEAGPDA